MMKIEIVDLKKNLQYLDEYIRLRNFYTRELLSDFVIPQETKKWITNNLVYIKVAIQEKTLLGVVILYLAKNNEVSIFTKDHNKGIGSLLLKDIEEFAREKKLKYLHSWIEDTNKSSQLLFLKQQYLKKDQSIKLHNNIQYIGHTFQKELSK